MQAVFETVFDLCYLIFVITAGLLILEKSKGRKEFRLLGAMAVTLGCGDAFHLVPRMMALCTTGMQDYTAALGIGKLITSVTMTLFYVLLYYVWKTLYPKQDSRVLTLMVWILAVIRIALCLFPQNDWTAASEPLVWGIWRNIPFAILGILMIVLFFRTSGQDKTSPFRWMWLGITLSFAFYIPVVLLSQSFPAVGILMIPKTCAYVWIVCMGWKALKKADARQLQ